MMIACPCASLPGQDVARERLESSPRHGEFITIGDGPQATRGFIVYPEVKDKATAVVVIHEIFGLTDWVRSVCDQLAENGFIAFAPDMLGGKQYESLDDARRAIGELKPEEIRRHLDASVDYLKALPAANGKVAVGGFCWGGAQTFRYAATRSDVAAFFPFYGNATTEAAMIDPVQAPVYGFFAENDARVNATLPEAETAWKAAGKTLEVVIYPGAGHGFMRAGEAADASAENKAARAEAWKRWLNLLSAL